MSWDEENNHQTINNNNDSSYKQQWNNFKQKHQDKWKQYLVDLDLKSSLGIA